MIFNDDFQSGWCPLICAAQDGHIEVVNTLLQYGATVDMADIVRTGVAALIITKLLTCLMLYFNTQSTKRLHAIVFNSLHFLKNCTLK